MDEPVLKQQKVELDEPVLKKQKVSLEPTPKAEMSKSVASRRSADAASGSQGVPWPCHDKRIVRAPEQFQWEFANAITFDWNLDDSLDPDRCYRAESLTNSEEEYLASA